MKKFTSYMILFFLVTFSLKAQETEFDLKSLRKDMVRSGLSFVDSEILKGKRALSPQELKGLFDEHRASLYGGVKDSEKFFALEELCNLIKKIPKRDETINILLREFEKLETIKKGGAGDWEELLVESRGGSLGLVTNCLFDLGGEKAFIHMFNLTVNKGDVEKMSVLFKVIAMRGEMGKYKNFLSFEKLDKFNKIKLGEEKSN